MSSIVTHPDTLNELAPYRELDTRLVLENMDSRKTTGRTADELAPVFDELPRAGFCLDLRTSIRSIRRWPPAISSPTDSAHDCGRCNDRVVAVAQRLRVEHAIGPRTQLPREDDQRLLTIFEGDLASEAQPAKVPRRIGLDRRSE